MDRTCLSFVLAVMLGGRNVLWFRFSWEPGVSAGCVCLCVQLFCSSVLNSVRFDMNKMSERGYRTNSSFKRIAKNISDRLIPGARGASELNGRSFNVGLVLIRRGF